MQTKFVFAAEESQIKSVRAKDTHLKIVYSDTPLRPGARTPLGYDMIEGVLIPNEDLNVVLLIYFLALWGHSHKTIAAYLNRANIISKKITYWHSSSVGYILNNPAYEGILNWHTSSTNSDSNLFTLEDSHTPIIGPTILHLRKQANSLKKTYGKMNTPFYFRELLKCKNCNVILTAKDNSPKGKSKQYLIYKCSNCKQFISIHLIHEAVFKELIGNIINQEQQMITNVYEQLYSWQLNLSESKEETTHQLNAHQEKLTRLTDSIHPNKSALIELFNDSIAHFQTKQNELDMIISTINNILQDSQFEKTITALLQSHLGNLSNTEARIFSLSFINEIKIDFKNNCDLTIDYRLTPFAILENILVAEPNKF